MLLTEKDLHEYNKWLMEVWNTNQLYIPFSIDAPNAFLDYRGSIKKLSKSDVIGSFPTEKEGEEYANSIISNGVCDNEDELTIYRNGIEFGWKACLNRIKGCDR